MAIIQEGKAKIHADISAVPSKKMEVFYNPVMTLNRDISIALLNAIDIERIRISDILAGSGVRAVRFYLEVDSKKIEAISVNDYSQKAIGAARQNFALNKIKSSKVTFHTKDASIFLLEGNGAEYIDIDPFGFPGKFLDAAALRISRGGILAVTATDVAALAGSSILACLRKYWARPLRNEFMHETGLRILIRRVQLIGAQYEKAFTPIFSYYKDHYMRVFFRCEKGKTRVDAIMKQHNFVTFCRKCLWRSTGSHELCGNCKNKTETTGPLWTGMLLDKKLAKKMQGLAKGEGLTLIKKIREESSIKEPYFYDIHKVVQKYKKGPVPKHNEIISAIRKKGHKAELTHFKPEGIRSSIGIKELAALLKSL